MIKISEEQLDQALKMAEEAACSRGPDCLWGKRKYLPPKNCCSIIDFRDAFEHDSPCLFGKAFELSGYRKTVYNFTLLELGLLENMEVIKRVQADIHDLHVFTQAFVLVFYPLFLANDQAIPFVRSGEIIEKEKELSRVSLARIARITGRKMAHINRHWLEWVSIGYLGSLRYPEKYIRATALLIEIFLAGIKEDKIRDILDASPQQKEAFFREIKNSLF